MNLTEKPLSSEYPYRGKIVNMRVDQALLPNGRQAVREVVEHPGGVCVAALTDREESAGQEAEAPAQENEPAPEQTQE